MISVPWAGLLRPLAILALLHAGAIFGFFYAWVCSTMWGLDATDPDVAIFAMQAMNASVRNPVFALGFFGTPVVLAAAALTAWRAEERRGALLFASAGLLYVLGAMVPTVTINVPLNEALATLKTPLGAAARESWQAYSSPWQFWNAIRAIAAGGALLLAGCSVMRMGRAPRAML